MKKNQPYTRGHYKKTHKWYTFIWDLPKHGGFPVINSETQSHFNGYYTQKELKQIEKKVIRQTKNHLKECNLAYDEKSQLIISEWDNEEHEEEFDEDQPPNLLKIWYLVNLNK